MSFRTLLLVAALGAASLSGAQAQLFNRPSGGIPGDGGGYAQQAQGQDPAGLLVRIDRLENQVRALTGQLEQSQFATKRLEDQLRKFQQDVEFRFQERGGAPARATPPAPAAQPQRRGDVQDPASNVVTAAVPPMGGASAIDPPVIGTPGRAGRRNDAFDPAANPDAPGAPRTLGQIPANGATPSGGRMASAGGQGLPNGPLGADGEDLAPLDGPMDLSPGGARPRMNAPVAAPLQQQAIAAPSIIPAPAGPEASPVSLPPVGPKADFDVALGALRQSNYDAAQTGFSSFMQKYPRDRMVPDAAYYLGESYARRGRHREAAEQYLKVSTDYSKSARAPDALVRLGMSLEKLGAKEQACATWGEVGRKYPNASANVRASADREIKRAAC